MKLLRAMVVASACLAGPASGHEGGTDARGVVKDVAPGRLVLMTTTGAELSVALVAETRIRRGPRVVAATEIRKGERAVVHAALRGGGLAATEVKLAEVPR
ncbi:MAG TPA: hypothetical protein VEB43_15330 [Anaeromyxobacter sp.]|nr:hypothetical protein [Anaeromyxobacter sp.]